MKARKRVNFKEYRLVKIMNLPDVLTFANLVFGLGAIYFAVLGNFFSASIMIYIAIVMDYLDGKSAVWLNQRTDFGREADSLADMVSFGIAPVVFGYVYYVNAGLMPNELLLTSLAFFAICGLTRLAQYNIMGYNKEFVGMPITLNGIWVTMAYFFSMPAMALPYLYIIAGILMVSSIKFKRL
jgi:CDP-diacylglycerol--serine O-phosphatidyltransferase